MTVTRQDHDVFTCECGESHCVLDLHVSECELGGYHCDDWECRPCQDQAGREQAAEWRRVPGGEW